MSDLDWMPKVNLIGNAAINVVVSDQLPTLPTPGGDARRIVRHGLADVLTWLGVDVGPKPGEPIHMFETTDPYGGKSIITSLHGLALLKEACS